MSCQNFLFSKVLEYMKKKTTKLFGYFEDMKKPILVSAYYLPKVD